ncbi:hypothetical protein ABVK25_011866 [Lepraria finkii]|uniref:Cytochrome P450 n=1 Tax=Lepraria finkii TaxID=1340010 RepID=A0ABR4AMN7_9LECA
MVLGRLGWLFSSLKFYQHCTEVHKYVDNFVYARIQQDQAKRQATPRKGKLGLLNERAKHTQSPVQLRNETLHVLSASWDTTAALLGWFFYFLPRNRTVFDKIRHVVLTDFASGIGFRKLNNCRHLQHCINEIFRVAAIIPVIERVCNQDTTLPRGGGPDGSSTIFLPKDSRVLISAYGMQHCADVGGSDVADFRPERWEGDKMGGPWDFVPFAGGLRKCTGQNFALSEASYTLVLLLQRFDCIMNMEPSGPI